MLSSLPQEVFEKGFYGVEDAFGGQKNGALVNQDAREDWLDEYDFTGWVQPGRSPSVNPMLDFVNKRNLGGSFGGGFKYGDPKVFEIGPLGGPFDAKDFADVGEVPGREVPGKNMAFVIV